MKILSFGAGAIGTYIGGSLALRGHQLVFVEQAEAAEKLKKTGLKLNLAKAVGQDAEADFSLQSPEVYFASSLEEALSFGPFDIALFALKSYDTDSALEGMRPFIKQLPPILCLQNGIDNEPALASILGENNLIPGTVTSAVGRRGVGEIILEKLRGVGIANTHTLSQQLYQAFLEAGLNPRMYQKSADMKWSKMLTNLLANPTSAILNMSPAEVFANDGLYRLEITQLSECLAVMKSQSINVVDLPGTPVKALALSTRLPIWLSKPFLSKAAGAGRGAKMPSFHIDLYSGRGKSEIPYLHGAVVRAGKLKGIKTPVNELLTNTLLGLTNGTIKLGEFDHLPGKFLAKL